MKAYYYKIGYNTLIQIIGKIITTGLALITTGFLTRFLGQEGFGNFTLAFVYLSFFSIFSDLGLQMTMVRELAKKTDLPSKIYGTYFWLKFSLVVFSTLLAIFCLAFFPYSRFLKIGIVIASIGVAVGLLNNYGTVVFQANLRLDLVTLFEVVCRAVSVALVMLLISKKASFYALLGTVLVGNLAGSLVIAIFIRRFLQQKLGFDFALAKKLVKKSLPVGLISFLAMLYFKIDTLFLSLLRSAAEVGIYGLAFKVIENLLVLWGFYMATAYPLLSKFLKKNKVKALVLWKESFWIALGSAVLIVGFGYFFSPLVIKILGGQEFMASITVLRILLFSVPVFFLNNLFFHFFLVIEKLKPPMIGVGASVVLNLVLNLVFIPQYGYYAASLNVLVSQLVILLVYFFYFKKDENFGYSRV